MPDEDYDFVGWSEEKQSFRDWKKKEENADDFLCDSMINLAEFDAEYEASYDDTTLDYMF